MNIEKIYDLPYPPSRVYAAWVSSNTVIAPATAMDINPVVGGHYRLLMETAEFSGSNEGKFLAVDPGKHVRYTWEWNGDGEVTEIDVTFSESETGTQIKLLHTGFRNKASVDTHDAGWDSYMEGFSQHLDRQ